MLLKFCKITFCDMVTNKKGKHTVSVVVHLGRFFASSNNSMSRKYGANCVLPTPPVGSVV